HEVLVGILVDDGPAGKIDKHAVPLLGGIHAVVVLHIHVDGKPDLLLVGETGRLASALPRLGEDGEEDRGQDGDDRNDDEKLDQGKTAALTHSGPPVSHETGRTSRGSPGPTSDTLSIRVVPAHWL